eukprot:jgi/Tetstr1/455665/TSEL_042476.t1
MVFHFNMAFSFRARLAEMVGSQLRKPCDQVNKVTVKRMRLFVNSCESLERALKQQAKHCGRKISNHSAGAEDSVVRDRAGESEATLQSFVNFLHASLDMECTTMMFNIRKHLDQKQWTQAVRAITCDSSTELSGPAKQLYVYHTANNTDMVDLLIQTAFSGSLRLTLASNWARAAHRKRWNCRAEGALPLCLWSALRANLPICLR